MTIGPYKYQKAFGEPKVCPPGERSAPRRIFACLTCSSFMPYSKAISAHTAHPFEFSSASAQINAAHHRGVWNQFQDCRDFVFQWALELLSVPQLVG